MFESGDVGEILVYSLILIGIAFGAFFPLAFIYSMLFGGLHQSKMFKRLLLVQEKIMVK